MAGVTFCDEAAAEKGEYVTSQAQAHEVILRLHNEQDSSPRCPAEKYVDGHKIHGVAQRPPQELEQGYRYAAVAGS